MHILPWKYYPCWHFQSSVVPLLVLSLYVLIQLVEFQMTTLSKQHHRWYDTNYNHTLKPAKAEYFFLWRVSLHFLSVVVSDGIMMLATTFYGTKDLPLTCPMSPVHLKHFLLMLSKFFCSSPGSTIDGSMVDLIVVYMWEFHLPQPRLEWFFFLFTSATMWRPFFTLNEHYWVTFCPHT